MVKIRRATPLIAFVLLAGGCSAATPATVAPPSASAAATDTTAAAPSPTDTPLPTETPVPTDRPSPKPTAVANGWADPVLVRSGGCSGLTAVIDPAGRYHVASICNDAIHYLSSDDGVVWSDGSFATTPDRLELDPQLTLDGDSVYLAYSLLAPTDGGCGDDGLQDVGVYTQSIKPPNGSWSEPVRVGAKGDHVQAFRVVDGTLYLTVTAQDSGGPRFFESQSGPTLVRVSLPGAVTTSLRVGGDGRARIAYATGHSLRYASVDGAHLTSTTVAATDKTYLQSPSLVLGQGDHAYLVWTQNTDNGGGCAGPDPGPLDGVYFATDASGTWKTSRLTRTPGQATLTLDSSTGRIKVIASIDGDLIDYESIGGATWTSTPIPGTRGLSDAVIRLNPLTGDASVLAVDYDRGIFLIDKH